MVFVSVLSFFIGVYSLKIFYCKVPLEFVVIVKSLGPFFVEIDVVGFRDNFYILYIYIKVIIASIA